MRPPKSGDGKRVCVAQIGAAHGIRGEVRVKSFTADPMAIGGYGRLETEDGSRTFEVVSLRPSKEVVIARLKGVDDRNAAEALTHLRLFVPRERLPPIDEDETYYQADLIGLPVIDPAGAPIGTVTAVLNFGAGDILELQPPIGRATLLLPFTKATVPVVDLAGGKIVADPPEGWSSEEGQEPPPQASSPQKQGD